MTTDRKPRWRPYLEMLERMATANEKAGKKTPDVFAESYWDEWRSNHPINRTEGSKLCNTVANDPAPGVRMDQ
jgi:hypothetical protein